MTGPQGTEGQRPARRQQQRLFRLGARSKPCASSASLQAKLDLADTVTHHQHTSCPLPDRAAATCASVVLSFGLPMAMLQNAGTQKRSRCSRNKPFRPRPSCHHDISRWRQQIPEVNLPAAKGHGPPIFTPIWHIVGATVAPACPACTIRGQWSGRSWPIAAKDWLAIGHITSI